MAENNSVVPLYVPHAEAKATITDLKRSGFAMNRLSIVGKDFHTKDRVVGYHNGGERMKAWLELGNFWGGLSGLLLGSVFYFIPGIGPIIVFGPLASWIISARAGAVMPGELSALGAGLLSIGIPKHSIMEYETALKYGKFIVIAHGTPDDIAKAKSVLVSPRAAQIVPIFRG
jgi:hypothetical protein